MIPPTEWHAAYLRELARTDPRYAALLGVVGAAMPVNRGLCLHLGAKLDGPRQRPCGCRYGCEIGAAEFAQPDGVCQSCPKWEADAPPG